MKKYIAIIVLFILVIPACVTYDKCVGKFGVTGDTTYIPYKVIIPKDSIITFIKIDSIPFLIPGDTHYIENPQTRAKIKYWKDMYVNAINIQAECDSIILRDTIICPSTVLAKTTETSALKKIWYKWATFSGLMIPFSLLVIILFTIIYLIFKKL